jgi:hypothetical protein
MRAPSPASRLMRLAACMAFIWFFFWVFTPFLVGRWSALERYGAVQEEHNIRSGALYYTDVPVTAQAERDIRDTIRFLPRGPGPSEPDSDSK